jgi:hypothetical protein
MEIWHISCEKDVLIAIGHHFENHVDQCWPSTSGYWLDSCTIWCLDRK